MLFLLAGEPDPIYVPQKWILDRPWSMLYAMTVWGQVDESEVYDLRITKIPAAIFRRLVLGERDAVPDDLVATKRARDYLAIDSLELKMHQIPHRDLLASHYRANLVAVDVSVMGAGKTYTSVDVARTLNLRMVVVCPNDTSARKWRKVARMAGARVVCVMTYNKLSGTKRSGSKSGLVRMTGVDPVAYAPTWELLDLVEDGVLLVLDEFHFAKNRSSMRSKAAVALCRSVTAGDAAATNSRVLLLSSTPIDRVDHVEPILYMGGMVQSKPMCFQNLATDTYDTPGVEEMVDWIETHSATPGSSRLTRPWVNPFNRETVVWQLYVAHIVPVLVFKMDYTYTADCANGYYNSSDESMHLVARGVQKLQSYYHDLLRGRANMGSIVVGMQLIEEGKYPVAVRLAKAYLDGNPGGKVVLGFGYVKNLEGAMRDLAGYGAVGIFGKVSNKMRLQSMKSFQSDPAARVVVLNPSVAGVSIDLDDKKGDARRLTILIPSYRFTELVQCMGRVTRCDSKSVPLVRFLYLEGCSSETKILNKIINKSTVMSSSRGGYDAASLNDSGVSMAYAGKSPDLPMPGSFVAVKEANETWLVPRTQV